MKTNFLMALIFMIGLLIPTSIGGIINISFFSTGLILLFFIIILILYRQNKVSISSLWILGLFNSVLIFFTIVSPYSEYSTHAPVYFLIITMIFCLNFNYLKEDINLYRYTLNIANVISLILSMSIIFEISLINNLLLNFYSYFYDELIINMITMHKPVNTFTTHSIAGFYSFIFFMLNILTYTVLKKKVNLFFSFSFMLFMFYIQSSTSLIYFFLSFFFLVYLFRKKKLFLIGSASLLIIYLGVNMGEIMIIDLIKEKLFSQRNGLKVRYDETGVLSKQIDLILDSPLKGYGYTSIPGLDYVDSGYIIYALRSSVIGMILLLLGLFLFLKRNLGMKFGLIMFLIFLSFEVGFSNLTYFRSVFIIPFIIAYFTQLNKYKNKMNEYI